MVIRQPHRHRPWLAHRPCGACANSAPSVRCDGRGARRGRGWHRRSSDRRTPGDASPLDRRVTWVRVIDPQHPLYGHCYPISERRSGRGPALIVIRLADGRERAVPRSALAPAEEEPTAIASPQAQISVRSTLLPLANHIRFVHASSHAALETGGERRLEQTPAAPDGVAGSAPRPVAAAAGRDTTSAGATDRLPCATSAGAAHPRKGGS